MDTLQLVVGLGNPGADYAQTRHNAGFMAIDRLAARVGAVWQKEERMQAKMARADFSGKKVLLCQPQTYMNLSGVSVATVARFYKLDPGSILVVVDDADLPLGQIRLRPSGSSGGHHGLDSVEAHLGTREYARLRIGIGRRDPGVRQIAGHVLGRFESGELRWVDAVLSRVVAQIECWITGGVQKAMNEFNGAVQAPMAKD